MVTCFRLWPSIGINVNAEDAAVGILEQRGIAFAADDVLVNRARLVGREQLGRRLLAVDLHREFVDLRGRGHGKKIGALELLRVRVVEFLIDAGGADLAVDLHVDVVVADLQRREGKIPDGPGHRPVDDDESIRADRGHEGDKKRECR